MTETAPNPTAPSDNHIEPGFADLLARHGELMDGRTLAALFKFGSDRSFRRKAAIGELPVSVFRVKGRRGWFARTRDVTGWLATAAESPQQVPITDRAEPQATE